MGCKKLIKKKLSTKHLNVFKAKLLKECVPKDKKFLKSKEEQVGRSLDFLTQEMNREVNTIGSKGNDAFISQGVVEMKGWIEQIKEQVQNVL